MLTAFANGLVTHGDGVARRTLREYHMALLFALLVSPVYGQTESVPTARIDSVKEAIVPVLCVRYDTTKNPNTVKSVKRFGTGFFVSREGYFVTASHVIRDARAASTDKEPCRLAISVPFITLKARAREYRAKLFSYRTCVTDTVLDIAACKVEENPFKDSDVGINVRALPLTSVKAYGDGAPAAFTGFPLAFGAPLTSKAYIAGYYPADEMLVLDKATWPGVSGGPVYDTNGLVIGLVIARGTNEGVGLTYARPADVILDFLRRNKIPTEQ